MALAKSQRSLKAWGKQKWRTKSGKKSSKTGERYLPEKAIKALTSKEYAATTRAKRKAKKKRKQIKLENIEHRKDYIMPQGKGTYGSKKGRPPKKKKGKKVKGKLNKLDM